MILYQLLHLWPGRPFHRLALTSFPYPYSSSSTNMLHLRPLSRPGSQISTDSPLEQLHHHPKQPSTKSGIPPPFRTLISNERMLSLHFIETKRKILCIIHYISDECSSFSIDVGVLFPEYEGYFTFARHVTVLDSDECVVALAFAESGTVDIGREVTKSREDTGVEGCAKSEVATETHTGRGDPAIAIRKAGQEVDGEGGILYGEKGRRREVSLKVGMRQREDNSDEKRNVLENKREKNVDKNSQKEKGKVKETRNKGELPASNLRQLDETL